MDMTIKRACRDDDDELFGALSELDRQCVGAEGWSPDSFRSEAEKDCGVVLYMTDNGHITALLCGYHAVGEGDITSVAVAPEYRRRGLALALIREFEELLPDDAESIFLEVRKSNQAAAALYEKCGFSAVSVRKRFYADPVEDAVVMIKNLK